MIFSLRTVNDKKKNAKPKKGRQKNSNGCRRDAPGVTDCSTNFSSCSPFPGVDTLQIAGDLQRPLPGVHICI
jgi:hypothetical protein